MITLDASSIELGRVGIGALPVVNAVLDRLGFDALVSSFLPEPDRRCLTLILQTRWSAEV